MGTLSRERLIETVEGALKSAFPDRASALTRELRIRDWGSQPARATPRCGMCLRSGRKRPLVWGRACADCFTLCHDLLPLIENPRAVRPPADTVLAEIMRAVRAADLPDDTKRQVLAGIALRFETPSTLGPTSQRTACSICGAMGPVIRGSEMTACARCIRRAVLAVRQDLRLAGGAPGGELAPLSRSAVLALASDALRRSQPGRAQRLIRVIERFFWTPIARRADRHGCSLCGRGRGEAPAYVTMRSEEEFDGVEGVMWPVPPHASFEAVRPPRWSTRSLRRGEELRALLCPVCIGVCRAMITERHGDAITPQEALLQAEGALGASGQARAREVVAALTDALAAMPQPWAADAGTCELCGGAGRPTVELPGLAFCVRCLEGAEEALAS